MSEGGLAAGVTGGREVGQAAVELEAPADTDAYACHLLATSSAQQQLSLAGSVLRQLWVHVGIGKGRPGHTERKEGRKDQQARAVHICEKLERDGRH